MMVLLIMVCLLGQLGKVRAEGEPLTIREAIDIAIENNLTLRGLGRNTDFEENSLENYENNFKPQFVLNGETGYTYNSSLEQGDMIYSLKPAVEWRLNPKTNLNLSIASLNSPDHLYSKYNSLALNRIIYGDKEEWEMGHKSKELALLSAKINLKEKERQIRYQVMERYFGVIKNIKLIDLRKEALKRSQEHLKKAEVFYKSGQIAKVDLLNAQIQVDKDRNSLKQAHNNLQMTKMRLNQLLGVDLSKEYSFNSSLKVRPVTKKEDKLIQLAYDNSLKLDLYSRRLEIKTEEYQRIDKTNDPLIRVAGEYNWEDKFEDGNVSLMVKLKYAPTSKSKIENNLDNNILEQANLKDDIKAEKLGLKLEVKEKYMQLNALVKELEVQKQIITRIEENLEAAQAQYRTGLTNGDDILDLQVELFGSKKDYYDKMVNYYLVHNKLGLLIGENN